MKNLKRVLPVLAIVLWALLLLPFLLGAPAAHPATDDFTFAVYTHPTWVQTGSILHVLKDALSYALRTWRDWQGTVTGVIIMTLNPAVFSIDGYGWHAVILLALCLLATGVFLRHFLEKRLGISKRMTLAAFLCLSAVQFLFLPDIVEGVYWFNGAWFYMGAQAVSLLTLTLADRVCERGVTGIKVVLCAALCWVLLFALGMDNYITAMMTAAALLMMALQRAWAAKQADEGLQPAIRTALMLLSIGIGLLLSVAAPGNNVRMAADGAHQSGAGWLAASVLWTMRDAVKFILRFSLKTPLLALMLLAAPTLCAQMNAKHEKGAKCPPIGATGLGLYLILCAMIIPHMYSSGYAGSGRVVNMYHCYVLLAMPITLTMSMTRIKEQKRAAIAGGRGRLVCYALAAAAFALCIAGGQIDHYQKLVSDQMNGTQDAYIAQFKHEYALCEAAGAEDDVLLPAWKVQTMTGKPTAYADASIWTNESMAQYFGVRSVRVEE